MSEPIQTAAGTPAAEKASPAETSATGRNSNGQFAKGNRFGPGNPFARQVAGLRKVLLDRVTAEDIQAIAEKLLQMAKAGDVAAAKLLLSYTIGKPQPAVEPDHLDVAEWEQLKATAFKFKELPQTMGPGMDFPLWVARNTRPGIASTIDGLFAKGVLDPQGFKALAGMFPGDAGNIAVAPAPSPNGNDRLHNRSANGRKRSGPPSPNGDKRPEPEPVPA